MSTTDSSAIGRRPDGGYQAYGYEHVLPRVFAYNQSTTNGHANIRFSFASLDRTTRMLTTSSDGCARASEAHEVSVQSTQGATAVHGEFRLSTGDGSGNAGDLATFRSGGRVVVHHDVLPVGPEGLSYWPAKGRLRTLTEHPSTRSVFAVRAAAY